MSRESPKTEVNNMDLNDVEMVFGTPSSPKKDDKAVHTISNEKRPRDQPGVHKPASESDGESTHPAQPLLEPERDRQKPPLAGPEVDDLDGDKQSDAAPYPGIDDGLLETGDKKPAGDEDTPNGSEGKDETHTHDDGVGTEDGKWLTTSHGHDETDFYYGGWLAMQLDSFLALSFFWYKVYQKEGYIVNGLHNRLGEADDRPISPGVITVIPDVNTYQQKKNLAQGMMDLALLSANANQLRYVLESSISHPYYYPSLVFIAFSIILQIAVGVGLIMNSRYNVKDEKDICKADKINNMTILGIFLITIVNVFITSFSVATPTVMSGGVAVAAVQQNG